MILAFVASAALLLSIPGPTNTLLAASGAAVGLRRSLRLILAAIGAYALAILILMQIYDRVFAGGSRQARSPRRSRASFSWCCR